MEARRESDREKRGGGGATAATVALPLPPPRHCLGERLLRTQTP